MIVQGDCSNVPLPDNSIDCIISSPSYWGLDGYGHKQQIGNHNNVEDYLNDLVDCCDEAYRVLKPAGTFWLISGDIHPSVCGLPWMAAFTLISRCRLLLLHDFIWSKPQRAHDYIFLFAKEKPCYLQLPEQDSSVWHFESQEPYPEALFEPLPHKLVESCIKCGCPPGGVVLNQFSGSGTVAVVAKQLGYDCISLDIDPNAIKIANERLR